jgi:GntR family transcriptional regulator/MocR family aminotransferase
MIDYQDFKSTTAAPIYQQLYDHLRASILDGRLEKGAKIPSTRLLAAELGVSRNTVLNAYDQLIAEGYIESIEGKGTFVTQVLPEQHLSTVPRIKRQAVKSELPPSRLSKRAEAILATPVLQREYKNYAFRAGVPALDAFPYELWAKYIAREAHRLHPGVLAAQDNRGYRPLREAIAQHVTVARQVRCTPEQVLVVSGAQGALDLAARVLVNPGEQVWMEDPGYPGARGALLAEGAVIVPVPVDADGLNVEAGIAQALYARMVYLTPSHQFPLGASLTLPRRLRLLNWANEVGSYLLEDDYDSEYRFTGRPLASLQGLDDHNRTIYIGTFSKVLFPALRLGYLIVPEVLVDAFCAVRRYVDDHSSSLEQRILAAFMSDGHFARHIRRMRMLYGERRQMLLNAVQGLPLEIVAPDTGMHLIGWLPEGVDDQMVAQQVAAQRVHVLPISKLAMLPQRRGGLVLGYAAINEQEILEGARGLSAAFQAMHI